MDRLERVQLSGSLLEFLKSMGCTTGEVIDIATNLKKQALVYDNHQIGSVDPVPIATLMDSERRNN